MNRALHPFAAVRAILAMLACMSSVTACTRTSTGGSELTVRQIWDEYLASTNGQFAATAGTPSSLWSATEQAQWPMYDLAGFYLPDHAVPEVLRVTRVDPAVDSAYQIVTQFWSQRPTLRDSSTKPVLTMSVFARREGDRWVLANALPFLTATWARETRGRISYRMAPTLSFNADKALRAAAFVDSLATAFGVPAVALPDETFRRRSGNSNRSCEPSRTSPLTPLSTAQESPPRSVTPPAGCSHRCSMIRAVRRPSESTCGRVRVLPPSGQRWSDCSSALGP